MLSVDIHWCYYYYSSSYRYGREHNTVNVNVVIGREQKAVDEVTRKERYLQWGFSIVEVVDIH